jgi:hemolysin D
MPVEASAAPSAAAKLPELRIVRRGDELEFLPAAIEIVESPVSPLGRGIAFTIIAFFVVAIAWSIIGKIDIIATAQGKIVPTGRTKTVQPLEAGIVTAIHVRDGDKVSEGQVLIEMDHIATTADRDRARYDMIHARLDAARLTALRAGFEHGYVPVDFAPPPQADAYEVLRTRATMMAQAEQQTAKIAALEQQIAQKVAEGDSTQAAIDKLDAGLPFLVETAEVRQKAMNIEFGNRIAHLDAQLKLSEQRHELIVQKRRLVETAAAKAALVASRAQTHAEYARGIVTDLSEAEQKAAQAEQDLIKAEKKISDQVLRAPVDGTVQQLAIHTVGGVVTPAQALLLVVPADSHLEAEAMVSNRDIGFVVPGQPAEVKIDTFNFTKYGLLHGQVMTVSQDAITRDKSADKNDQQKTRAALSDTSEPEGQELVYSARVSLDRTEMQVEDKIVSLAPGMAVTVEIKTGQRRVIEYLLSPLLRYRHEAIRER